MRSSLRIHTRRTDVLAEQSTARLRMAHGGKRCADVELRPALYNSRVQGVI